METYNSSIGSPTAMGIVNKGGTLVPDTGKMKGAPVTDVRTLDSAYKNPAFFVAHDNSVNQIVKVRVLFSSSICQLTVDVG